MAIVTDMVRTSVNMLIRSVMLVMLPRLSVLNSVWP